MVTIRSAGCASAASAGQGGLAGVGAARDDHVEAGPHRGGKNRVNSSLSDRPGRRGWGRRGGDDGSTRTGGRHLDHGREPVPAGEVEVDDGLGGIDPAFSAGVVRPGGPLDQLDQIRVAVRDRLDPFLGAIGAFHPHVIGPVDVDVLDVVLVEEQLEAAESQLRGDQTADDLILFFGTRRGDAPLDYGTGGLVDRFAGQLLDEGRRSPSLMPAVRSGRSRRRRARWRRSRALGVRRRSRACPPVRSGCYGHCRVGGPLRRRRFVRLPRGLEIDRRWACAVVLMGRGRRGQLRRRPRPGPARRRPLLRCPLLRCALLRCRLLRCPVKRPAWLAHLRSAVRSSRLERDLLASASAALRSSGIAGPTATPRVLPISAPE